jgi:hypothetical protein
MRTFVLARSSPAPCLGATERPVAQTRPPSTPPPGADNRPDQPRQRHRRGLRADARPKSAALEDPAGAARGAGRSLQAAQAPTCSELIGAAGAAERGSGGRYRRAGIADDRALIAKGRDAAGDTALGMVASAAQDLIPAAGLGAQADRGGTARQAGAFGDHRRRHPARLPEGSGRGQGLQPAGHAHACALRNAAGAAEEEGPAVPDSPGAVGGGDMDRRYVSPRRAGPDVGDTHLWSMSPIAAALGNPAGRPRTGSRRWPRAWRRSGPGRRRCCAS